MVKRNEMCVEFDSLSVNESFARMTVAAFLAELNPTLDELADVKTAVSEAVTNAIIHGYENKIGKVSLYCLVENDSVEIHIADKGKGIVDIEQAKTPFFTTKPELERSGMGFAFMEAFMDEVEVKSEPGCGTTICMKKRIGRKGDCKTHGTDSCED